MNPKNLMSIRAPMNLKNPINLKKEMDLMNLKNPKNLKNPENLKTRGQKKKNLSTSVAQKMAAVTGALLT